MNNLKVGVFDSGVGGLSVVSSIKSELPQLNIIYKDDSQHVPYGTRNIEEIHGFVKPIMEQFINEGCKVIVVACNTVTTNLIDQLRQEFNVPFVGMEPMVKPAAAASKSKIIAVCATPRTLSSQRYKWLKEEFAKGVKVLEPDCSDWAAMIETNSVNKERISAIVDDVCSQGADQIVLGCTHYHWIEDKIKEVAAGRAEVMQPEAPVIAQLKTVLSQLS